MAADGEEVTGQTTAETPGDREELRTLVAQLRTNIAARGRSGLLGVPLTAVAPPKAASGGGVTARRAPRHHKP